MRSWTFFSDCIPNKKCFGVMINSSNKLNKMKIKIAIEFGGQDDVEEIEN